MSKEEGTPDNIGKATSKNHNFFKFGTMSSGFSIVNQSTNFVSFGELLRSSTLNESKEENRFSEHEEVNIPVVTGEENERTLFMVKIFYIDTSEGV